MAEGTDVNINGKINVDNGLGFFGLFVGKNTSGAKGNININPEIGDSGNSAHLEGIYFADGVIATGVGEKRLFVRGSFVGSSGFSLGRTYPGTTDGKSAEYFKYAPDQIMLFPEMLKRERFKWQEVAP